MNVYLKVFLLLATMYLVFKVSFSFIMYVVTRRVEEKALAKKRKRERMLTAKRTQQARVFKRQYREAQERNCTYDAIS